MPTKLLLAVFLLLPACGWLWGGAEPAVEEVELSAPWDALGLPVAGAAVTLSDADTLTVRHPDGDAGVRGASYGAALTAAGWTLALDTSAGGIVNQTWDKEGSSLALSAMEDEGRIVVSLSRLPF